MIIIRTIPIALLVLLIILQRIDIRITTSDITKVRINFIFIAILLSESSATVKRFKFGLKIVKNLPTLLKTSNYFLSKSQIVILRFFENDGSSANFNIVKLIPIYISATTLLAYLNSIAKSVTFDTRNKSSFDLKTDITISVRFVYLIISSLLFLYYCIVTKIRRIVKNV